MSDWLLPANRPAAVAQPPEVLTRSARNRGAVHRQSARRRRARTPRPSRQWRPSSSAAPRDRESASAGNALSAVAVPMSSPATAGGPERQLPCCAGEEREQQRHSCSGARSWSAAGSRIATSGAKSIGSHERAGSPIRSAHGIPRLHAEPDTEAEAREIERVPEELCRHRARGRHRRERREEERLERRADEAIGGAAAGVERFGVQKPPPALEEDRGIAAFVDALIVLRIAKSNARSASSPAQVRGG